MDTAGLAHVRQEITARLTEGRLTKVSNLALLICSPIGTVPKPHSTSFRTIHHLSHPCRPGLKLPSVNTGIQLAFVSLQYKSLRPLIDFVCTSPGCWLWKGDLQDAFRNIVTCLSDARLLGFTFDSVSYRENALTFGGKSSPWLFNLYAEMVHWIVSSCLPPGLPLNHYLDNFFRVVPAGEDSSRPVRLLALTCKALGLALSPSKTFFSTKKLEVLGIEIDTEALTIGITDTHRSSFLCTIQDLLQSNRVSLLQLQHISGLLQFVTQMAPLGRAYLGRLYAALRLAHCSPLSQLRLPQPALAELRWWCQLLSRWNGLSLLLPSPLCVAPVWIDTCPRGLGGLSWCSGAS